MTRDNLIYEAANNAATRIYRRWRPVIRAFDRADNVRYLGLGAWARRQSAQQGTRTYLRVLNGGR